MSELLLGPVLRHVTTTSATVWVETVSPCTVEVLGCSARTFSVCGHHYALVIMDGLEPDRCYEYDVCLDGRRVWPKPDDPLPPPRVRTLGGARHTVLFGSCRAALPHEPPYTLELDHDSRGRGVDALRTHGLRMLTMPEHDWPSLLMLLGDQVYADDPSPKAKHRIARWRDRKADAAPVDIAGGFEEYTWLYHESWSPQIERWVLSVVPSTMIFDDHDMIDDWNISRQWVDDIRAKEWWHEHVVGGLMSYWIYQQLGNLSPERIADEGMLAALNATGDGDRLLREWAEQSEQFTPVPGGYHFNYDRDIGDVKLIVIDSRNGRVLDPGARRMVDDDSWSWITERAKQPCRHLVLASSLPMLVPGGLHDLQQWNEAICAGRWGRVAAWTGERIRRALDLEDWAAFDASMRALCDLLADIGSGEHAPETITLLAGDIHFAYSAEARFADDAGVSSRIRQVVSSPIRNALATRERRVIRFAISCAGVRVGRTLRKLAKCTPTSLTWDIDQGPFFDNNIGTISFETDGSAKLQLEQAKPDDDGNPILVVLGDTPL